MGTRAGKYKFGARAGKHKMGARAGKYKLGARAGKYKSGARAEPGTGAKQRAGALETLTHRARKVYKALQKEIPSKN